MAEKTEQASPLIAELVARARVAQREFESYDQAQVDEVVTAIGWAVLKNADYLGELELRETGMGDLKDKCFKNYHRTKGAVWDLVGKKSVGILDDDPNEPGVTRIAKPVGVVGCLTPTTNAAAGTVGNALMVCKCRNAAIFAPHPRARRTSDETIRLIREELARIGAPVDLVQGISEISKEVSQDLMRNVDLVVATGGAAMVRTAYSSGTPSLGVGAGNSVVIVDETADIPGAAEKIARGKTFDNATSCSSENSVIVHASVYDAFMREMSGRGGYVVTPEEKARLQRVLWDDHGVLNPKILCRPALDLVKAAEITGPAAATARFLIVPETGYGRAHPFSGEKLSPVLTAYRYTDFAAAVQLVKDITSYNGRGHSCGLHSAMDERAVALATAVPVSRVLLNQAQAFGNSGNFNNGLPFTATLGCGTWGGNSVSENVTYKHMMNITRLARPLTGPEFQAPTDEQVFGAYWARRGRG
jgi:sulfoacetaldehyde dehydrogenase